MPRRVGLGVGEVLGVVGQVHSSPVLSRLLLPIPHPCPTKIKRLCRNFYKMSRVHDLLKVVYSVCSMKGVLFTDTFCHDVSESINYSKMSSNNTICINSRPVKNITLRTIRKVDCKRARQRETKKRSCNKNVNARRITGYKCH